MLTYLRIFAGLAFFSATVFSQNTGQITGNVKDATGAPIAGARVEFTRLTRSKSLPANARWTPAAAMLGTNPHSFASVGASGDFRLTNAEDGIYAVCPSPPAPYLNPCIWDRPVEVKIKAGIADQIPNLKLVVGSVLQVSIDDPNGVLPKSESAGALPVLLCGVRTANGGYIPAQLQSGAAMTKTYQVTVPQGTPLRLSFSSRRVRLLDTAGVPMAFPQLLITFQVPAGQKQFNLSFTARALTQQEASSIQGK